MVQIVNRAESFLVRLICAICGERCRLDTLWLAFRPGEIAEGSWVHRECVNGRCEAVFGVRRVTLMRGEDALRRIAEHLDDAADVSLQKRLGAVRTRPLPGDAMFGVQQPRLKARVQ